MRKVRNFFPTAQLTIAPSRKLFLLRFRFRSTLTPEDLTKIAARAADSSGHLTIRYANFQRGPSTFFSPGTGL